MDNFENGRISKAKKLTVVLVGIAISILAYFVSLEDVSILEGLITIITSPGPLVTDYLVIGGLGATLINASLIFLFNFTLIKLLDVKVNGLIIASLFTVFGFSFFGKNCINILPIYAGGILYSKYERTPFKDILAIIMFTSTLAPFISEVAFNGILDEAAYVKAISLGVIIGFIITPIAKKMAGFHEGFNLYNLGFTGGIVGTILASILKSYNFPIVPQSIISTEHDFQLKVACLVTFLFLIIIGFYINGNSFKGFKELIDDSGYKVDFTAKYGYGLTFINMGITGFVAVGFLMSFNEILNGPFIAGVLTVVGFGAMGKHFKNTIPILLGVAIASVGTDTSTFIIVLSGLFGTALAPISGVYGIFWGIVAGWLHLAVVKSSGAFHGGLNLYNNGFSAGMVAGFLLPIIRTFKEHKDQRTQKYYLKKKELYTLMMKEEDAKEALND